MVRSALSLMSIRELLVYIGIVYFFEKYFWYPNFHKKPTDI